MERKLKTIQRTLLAILMLLTPSNAYSEDLYIGLRIWDQTHNSGAGAPLPVAVEHPPVSALRVWGKEKDGTPKEYSVVLAPPDPNNEDLMNFQIQTPDGPMAIKRYRGTGNLEPPTVEGVDRFGSSIDISGNAAVVGAWGEEGPDDLVNFGGAIFMIVDADRDGDWSNATVGAAINPPDLADNDEFGYSVAISGSTIAVGAPGRNNGTGAVYVYVDPNQDGNWTDITYRGTITASNAGPGDKFGFSVDIENEIIIIGAPFEGGGGKSSSGGVYIYKDPNGDGDWSTDAEEVIMLKAPNLDKNDQFGYSVAIAGTAIAIGAPFEQSNSPSDDSDDSMTAAGAAYVFTDLDKDGNWDDATFQKYLKADAPAGGARYGTAIAISSYSIVVGATYNGVALPGKAFVYSDPDKDGDWTDTVLEKSLVASITPAPGNHDYFGESVAITDGDLVVGGNSGVHHYNDLNQDGNWSDATLILPLYDAATAVSISPAEIAIGDFNWTQPAAYIHPY